jgi:probable HAF family extracellular repeat protein
VTFLRDSSGNIYSGVATAVSGNGSVIVGDNIGGGAFRWANGVAAPIPQVEGGGGLLGSANAVSTDGTIIAGDTRVTAGGMSPYMLTGSILDVIPLPTGDYSNPGIPGSIPFIGTTMSANGAVVAGNPSGGGGGSPLGTWQWKNGALIQSPGGTGYATAVSPDGSVVVGSTASSGAGGLTQAFEWTNGVVTPLNWPAGYVTGSATAVSTDGTTIVGEMSPPASGGGGGGGPSVAFIWNQAGGVQNLQQVLISDGLGSSLTGWTLTAATGITPDGNTIVGNGTDPSGQTEGWIVRLNGPPQPPITWANPANIVYGTPLGATQLDATASVPGTFTYSPPAGTLLHAGNNQALSVTFTPTDTADYTTATATVSINVLRATTTITWANPSDMLHGTSLGPTQLDASAVSSVGGRSVSVPGNFAYSPGAGTLLPVGNNQALSVTFTPADTTDYTGATATVTINVLPGKVSPPPQVHATRIILTAKPRSARAGRIITLTATVANLGHVGGVPTGSLDFLEGTTLLGPPVRLRRGKAILKTSLLPLGQDTIRADYSGDENHAPSDSATIIVTIRAGRTRTRVTDSLAGRRMGGPH